VYEYLDVNGQVLFYPPSLASEPAVAAGEVLGLCFDISAPLRESINGDVYDMNACRCIARSVYRVGLDLVSIPVHDNDVWAERVNDLLKDASEWLGVDLVLAWDDTESLTLSIRRHSGGS
jgi:hypothetical protein